jgi:[protein-PII] uridylyltransferase
MHQRLNKLLIQGKGNPIGHPSESLSSSHERLQNVKDIRKIIEEQKLKIRERHKNGGSGVEIVKEYTALVDDLIINMYQAVIKDLNGNSPFTLVALGGYGRGELNPFSDIDILFLYDKKINQHIDFAIHNIISILWDIGFKVGHSARSISDCLAIAKNDITARTAMVESRYLAGDKEIFDSFFASLKRDVMRKGIDDFIKLHLDDTRQRHSLYGNTVCVSEPNIKDGPGGLRDLHTAMWVSMSKFGFNALEGLERRGIIDSQERSHALESLDFLFRVRNDMHFLSEGKNDVLSHEIQEAVANNLGYRDDNGLRAVTRFMKDYYISASHIYHFSNSLLDRCLKYKPGIFKRIAYLKTKDIGDGFVSIGNEIHVKDLNLDIFRKNPTLLIKVFLYCQELNLILSSSIKKLINSSLSLISGNFINLPESNEIFRRILKGRELSRTLRMMHECGVLNRFFKEFKDITFFSNCDFYHKFTVDEHTLRSLEHLEGLSLPDGDAVELKKIYRSITDSSALKIAVLMHDIGKKDTPGHSERGAEIAVNVLKRWGMDDASGTVAPLIREHLLMNQIALRRDMHDEKTISEFCRRIRTIENLKMLYLLTYADLKGVGTDVWTNWKAALLWELYLKAYEYFSKGEEERVSDRSLIIQKEKEILALIDNESDRNAADKYFSSMPEKYILSTSPEKILRHIRLAGELDGKRLVIKYFQNKEVGYTELMVCTVGKAGVFSKIAGTLTSKNMNILGAQIYTRLDGVAIDTLQVSTVDGKLVLDEGMLKRFEHDLLQVVEGEKTVEELLSTRQRLNIPQERGGFRAPTKVEIDNTLSDTHTIIEVMTADRLGILYDITHTLFNLGLNIYIAKISTEGKTVIDVFYVTEINGGKILEEGKIEEIKDSLLKALK